MTELSDFLTENQFITKENPLQIRDIIEVQKSLLQAGFHLLPECFIKLLKIHNGIQSQSGAVLGIAPENKSLDILSFNKLHNHSTQKIIIGYDDFAFLIYDFKRQAYFLIDKHDNMELDDFLEDELLSAISSVLHF